MNIRRITTIITIAALFVPVSAYALDGYFVGKQVVYPAWNSQIVLSKAVITIEPNENDWDVVSKARYYNKGKSASVLFGFPRPPKKREFKTYLGNRIRTPYSKTARSNSKIKNLYYDKVYTSWIKIGTGGRADIKHTYSMTKDKDENGFSKLIYPLKPAKLWKGKVNSISILIKNVDTNFLCSIKPKGYKIGENKITWSIKDSNPGTDVEVIWRYDIKEWYDKSAKILEGAGTASSIDNSLSEGVELIDSCFNRVSNEHKLLKNNSESRAKVIELYLKLIGQHPFTGDISRVIDYKKFIYKFSGDKNSLKDMYGQYLEKVKDGEVASDIESIETIAKDCDKYLEDPSLALASYDIIFNGYNELLPEERLSELLCKLASRYADNGQFEKAVKTFASIRKYSEKEADLKHVLSEMKGMLKDYGSEKMGEKSYLKANKKIVKLSKNNKVFMAYEFGALRRIAGHYMEKRNYRKALRLYNKIDSNDKYSPKLKKYIAGNIVKAKKMAREESEPLYLTILKFVGIVILLISLILSAETINRVYAFYKIIYRIFDSIACFIIIKLLPVFRFLMKPFTALWNLLSEKGSEYVEDRMSVSLLKAIEGVTASLGKIVKTFIANFVLTFKFISKIIMSIVGTVPREARRKLRLLIPVPSREYFVKIFSIFKREKKEAIKVSGEIRRSRKLKGDVVFSGNVHIKKGVTLTVRPGTSVKFIPGHAKDAHLPPDAGKMLNKDKIDVVVYGELMAEGRDGMPVSFEGEGFGSIIFAGKKKSSVLKHCNIEGGINALKCYAQASPEITRCTIFNSSGFALSCSDSAAPNLENCSIQGNKEGGALFCDNSAPSITSCIIKSNGKTGLSIKGTSNAKINNTRVLSSEIGIECSVSSVAKLNHNIIQDNNEYGVLCTDKANPKIRDNDLGNNGTGIHSTDSTEPVIENNRIRGGKFAILCTGDSVPVINGNTLSSNNVGIAPGNSVDISVSSNRIIGSIEAGIKCEGGRKHVITDNEFTRNQSGISCLDNSTAEIANNQFSENKTAIECSKEARPVIKDNTFDKNTEGIACLDSSAPVINNNMLRSSVTAIKCINNSRPELLFNTFEKNDAGVITGSQSSPRIDGSNMYKDNREKTLEVQEEGKEVVVDEYIAEGAGSNTSGLDSINGLTVQEELREGKPVTVLTAVEEAIMYDLVEESFSDDSLTSVASIAEYLRSSTGRITINVHTDNTGNPAYNIELSKKIATSLRDYYVTVKGLDGSIIVAEGYGGEKPVMSNENEEGRHKNRRVEIVISNI